MSEAEHPPITAGVIIIPQGFKAREREREEKVEEGGGGGHGGGEGKDGGVGCGTIGTGSVSGNSSTCHHNCMLLESVRQGRLGSAGKLEEKQQRQLEQQRRQQAASQADGWSGTGLLHDDE